MDNKIFSGENSKELWKELRELDMNYSKDSLIHFVYILMCKIQELEAKVDKHRHKQERF